MEIIEFHANLLEPLRKLYLESRKSAFTWLNTDKFELTDFDRDTEGERIWLAMELGDVIGFISVWQPDNFIHHLYIAPAQHRKGIGTRLLDIAKSNYSELSLKCMVHNENAINFYESKGFIRDGEGGDGLERYCLMTFRVQT